ncbi:MAG: carboxypeptidase-like regulatory domain-containing protein, partial [Planctomycetota bacterium]|nr:carboxypeptidase-like regulatory domain-containing protein [Planctomycetota bacterium]
GSLHLPPTLEAWTHASPAAKVARTPVELNSATLEFEVSVRGSAPDCELLFPDLLRPTSVNGALLGESKFVVLDPAVAVNLIEVEVRPHLAIQRLHDPSGRPLAGGSINAALKSGGSSTSWGEHLDSQGRYFFDLERRRNMEHMETLQFKVSWPPEIGSSVAPPIPVQDLELLPQPLILRFSSTKTLHFRIVDPQRAPIAGAEVRLGDAYGAEQQSDEDGRASALQSSPPAAQVRVQADGYLTVYEALTAASEVEQEVILWPGSWIEIVGAEQPEDGWGQLDLEILFDGDADGSLLTPQRFQTGQFTENSGSTGTESNSSKRFYKHTTALSTQGRARLDGIHVDVPATVRVTYHGSTLLETRVPVRPGDGGHPVQVPKLPELVEVRGRVVDRSGAPVPGVQIRARFSERDSVTVESGPDGAFRVGSVVTGANARLVFIKPGYGYEVMDYLVEARDDDSVGEVTLAPGAHLVVRILRPDGSPFVAAPGSAGDGFKPRIEWKEAVIPPSPDRSGLAAGEWRFMELPAQGAGMRLSYPGDRFSEMSEQVPAGALHFTVTLSEQAVAWLDGPG